MVSPGTKSFFILLLLLSCLSLSAQHLQEGDLLFCCSDSANAITAVTSGVEGLPIDHVGVVHHVGGDDGPVFVIEAVKPAVCLTPIDSFLCENGTVLVGRVNVECDIAASITGCLAMLGKPYESFRDSTGCITDYWIDFYRQHGMNVPDGAPGSNPGELSRRSQVTIIGRYP